MSDPKRVVKLAKQFREVLDVAEDLAKIDDLEQVRRNATEAAHKAKQEVWDIQSQLTEELAALREIKDELKLAKKEAEDTISLAKQAAQELINDAKEEAKLVYRRSLGGEKMVADRIVLDQEQHATRMRDYALLKKKAHTELKIIEEKLAEVRAQIGLS